MREYLATLLMISTTHSIASSSASRTFLEIEYATENLLFVEAVWRMKRMPLRDVKAECEEIWNQFMGPGAEMLVNVDSKTRRTTEQNMKNADRWTFDDAAAHLYYLMSRDETSCGIQ